MSEEQADQAGTRLAAELRGRRRTRLPKVRRLQARGPFSAAACGRAERLSSLDFAERQRSEIPVQRLVGVRLVGFMLSCLMIWHPCLFMTGLHRCLKQLKRRTRCSIQSNKPLFSGILLEPHFDLKT